jgi:hypothetical protein
MYVTLEIFFTREAVWILCITSKLFSGNWGWDAAEAYRDQCGKAWHHWKKNYAISVFHCHVELLDLHAKCEILDLEQTQQLRQSRCKKQWAHLEKFRDAFFWLANGHWHFVWKRGRCFQLAPILIDIKA